METSKAEPLDDAAATLNHLSQLMQDCGLRDTAQFLAMAKTQLMIELNGISDSEFRALCDWLEGGQGPTRGPIRRGRVPGTMTVSAMRRAWQCPQDAAPGCGRRRAHWRSRLEL